MTDNVFIELAISFAGIMALVGLARLIFPNAGKDTLSEESVRARIAFEEPDFAIDSLVIDQKRAVAVAAGADGDVVLIKKAGDGLVARRAARGMLTVDQKGAELSIPGADHTFRSFVISAANDAEALQWAVRIRGEDAI